jgi:hypothetical protein
MKTNSAIALGIVASLIMIGLNLSIVIMDMLDIGYWYDFPYLVFIGSITLGLVLLSVGAMGLLSKTKHKNGFNICLTVGTITLIMTFLTYILW